MADILIGTCGWTDPALLTSGWYPPGHRDAEKRLRHYATRFPVVEVDSPYYALPTARTTTLWAERTPPGFRFDVKAFSLLTGHSTRPAALPADLRGHRRDEALRTEVWARYAEAVTPLRDAGRLGTLLFQFPPSLTPGPEAEAFVRAARERARDWPFAVEFRDPAWWRTGRTAAFLADIDASAVATDTVEGMTPAVVTTPRLAVVRFHGRSPLWGTGTKEERFRHTYTPAELTEWLPRVRDLSRQTGELHLLFNNCCGDAAPRAAQAMHDLLTTAFPHQQDRTSRVIA
ncbi:DUF72 domain-containing protein [Streptomyces dangxiongensis]|uniref:DUF72 domain-containing protein n=1 Tax=Streptomyces dangxiongensis TaxID=1442032 RepID=A0A3G2JND9_9ACTN|nr:DUF72 domain-containing protein [Streptomyces dangxiongensis]AYN43874.1 DUF72 domain-containing protein [Streptomyces dangxiongensis]